MTTFVGLPQENVSDAVKKWAVAFDFDSDSCYPAPAMSKQGEMNGGLEISGSITGDCRGKDQIDNANTYCRMVSITEGDVTYKVYMYALYFQKDQGDVALTPSLYPLIGHRHDWEYALVWTKNEVLTHASFSAHGKVTTKAKEELHFDDGKPDTVKAVYHKDGFFGTHSIRPANEGENPGNNKKEWVTPKMVEWSTMKIDTLTNLQLQYLFNTHNFGKANCSFNDTNFPNEIAKNPPEGYPSADAWKKAATVPAQPSSPSPLEPPIPPGLVTRWLVLAGRDSDRDNRTVPLRSGQQARIVVHLPSPQREQFRFNIKHDKRGAEDRGRTDRIGHGDFVNGDAYDWSSFGDRLYLGERGDSDKAGLELYPNGFYVDLVLVQ